MWTSRDLRITFCIAFAIGLLCSGFFVAFVEITDKQAWCGAITKDDPIQKCARDWMNATGNLLTVLVATVAAYFAFRQYWAAKIAIQVNRLPDLNARINRLLHISNEFDSLRIAISKLKFSCRLFVRSSKQVESLKPSDFGLEAIEEMDEVELVRFSVDRTTYHEFVTRLEDVQSRLKALAIPLEQIEYGNAEQNIRARISIAFGQTSHLCRSAQIPRHTRVIMRHRQLSGTFEIGRNLIDTAQQILEETSINAPVLLNDIGSVAEKLKAAILRRDYLMSFQ